MRNLGLTHINNRNSSNRAALDGGLDMQPGSHDAHAIQSSAGNVIQFPRPVSSLGSAANSRTETCELFIDDREFATSCFLAIFSGLVLLLIGLGYAGYRAFIT